MANSSPLSPEAANIRQIIHAFIEARLHAKLDKLPQDDPDKRQQSIAGHQPLVWLKDAAHRRIGWIQLATHTLKPLHPDARGTNLHISETPSYPSHLVGTHSLSSNQREDDVVGNAAALDVYAFLKLSYEGKTLLQRILDAEPTMQEALSDDPAEAKALMQMFAEITQSKTAPASHTLAKQLYFPLLEGGYHLLAPLFPTTLVHFIHTTIREDRFGDPAKAAREARSKGEHWGHGYREYPNLAVQKFGGTKPQNISQLNSERYGENWLLPSLPPDWHTLDFKPPMTVTSVFGRWLLKRQHISQLTKSLRNFLSKTAHNNLAIRQHRASLVADICDEVLVFAAELKALEPGWTAQSDCKLDEAEALWLDQDRAKEDDEFRRKLLWGEWKSEVLTRFGHWLNANIETERTPMGDSEQTQWKKDLDRELRMFWLELDSAEVDE